MIAQIFTHLHNIFTCLVIKTRLFSMNTGEYFQSSSIISPSFEPSCVTASDVQAEKSLVFYLGTCDPTSFKKFCDNNIQLFGPVASAQRRYWQHRKQHLKKKPQRVKELFLQYFPHPNQLALVKLDTGDQPFSPCYSYATPSRVTPSTGNTSVRSPPSSIRPRNLMKETTPNAKMNNEFFLHLDDPENNPYGVFVCIKKDERSGSALVDQLNIYFLRHNVNHSAASTTFRLAEDGRGVYLNCPCQPTKEMIALHYFTAERKNLSQHGVDWDEFENDAKYKDSMEVIEERLDQLDKTGGINKDFYYQFPDGMTCNSDHFNANRKNGLDVCWTLDNLPYELTTKSDSLSNSGSAEEKIHYFPTMRIRLAIDGKNRDLRNSKAEVDAVADALSAMQLKMKAFRKGT